MVKKYEQNYADNAFVFDRFFDEQDKRLLIEKQKGMSIDNVAFCSFENDDVKSGGLGAVTSMVLSHLDKNVAKTILITPHHRNCTSETKLSKLDKVFSFDVDWYNDKKHVAVLEKKKDYDLEGSKGTVFDYRISCENFFDAKNKVDDPYLYEDEKKRNELLRRDALFYSKVVPLVLERLGITRNVVLHLNDWQTSLVNLTIKDAILSGDIESARTFQLIHNPFDNVVYQNELENIVSNPKVKKTIAKNADFFKGYNSMTHLGIGLGLIDTPLTTVSKQTARDFTSDVLYTDYFAPHLQVFFKNGVAGVNNGLFVNVSKKYPKLGRHSFDEISRIKKEARSEAIKVLDTYKPNEKIGELTHNNGPITSLSDNVPLFMMSGRLDTSQKGYDILLNAISRIDSDSCKFVLAPTPVNDSDLDFFRAVAEKCKGKIVIYPKRMTEGYAQLQSGVTYAILPSIYEPFGCAIEFMAQGTPVIARRTGGLIDQIEDGVSGIFYDGVCDDYTISNIKDFFSKSKDVRQRSNNSWNNKMIDDLVNDGIRGGMWVYKHNPEMYHGMIINGLDATKNFSLTDVVKKYHAMYKA